MSEKPLECTSCGKLKDYGEPHNFYDCVQYLKGVIRAKDAQIGDMQASLDGLDDVLADKDEQIAALVRALRYIKGMTVCDVLGDRFMRAQQAATVAIKEAGE